MEYLMIIIGLILVGLTWRETLFKWQEKVESENSFLFQRIANLTEIDNKEKSFDNTQNLEEKIILLKNIENKIDFLQDYIQEIVSNDRNSNKKLQNISFEDKKELFNEILHKINKEVGNTKKSKPRTLNDNIYDEYKKGSNITEIAKKFNKGKGEIELILNLYH